MQPHELEAYQKEMLASRRESRMKSKSLKNRVLFIDKTLKRSQDALLELKILADETYHPQLDFMIARIASVSADLHGAMADPSFARQEAIDKGFSAAQYWEREFKASLVKVSDELGLVSKVAQGFYCDAIVAFRQVMVYDLERHAAENDGELRASAKNPVSP